MENQPVTKGTGKRRNPFWDVAVFIMIVEAFERLTYYAIMMNLVHYMTNFLGFTTDVTLNVKLVFNFVGYASAVGWGIVSDSFLGKKLTILICVSAYALCTLVVTISTIPQFTHHAIPGQEVNPIGQILFLISIFGVALCMGGIKANISPLGADQFNEDDPYELEQMKSFFTWFYILIQCGGVISGFFPGFMHAYDPATTGYTIGYGMAAGFICVGLLVFSIRYNRYVEHPASATRVKETAEALCSAIARSLCRCIPAYRSTDNALEQSAVQIDDGSGLPTKHNLSSAGKRTNWVQRASKEFGGKFDATVVDDAHQVTRVMPVFPCYIMFCVVYAQSSGQFIVQGEQMDNRGYFNSTTIAGLADPIFW